MQISYITASNMVLLIYFYHKLITDSSKFVAISEFLNLMRLSSKHQGLAPCLVEMAVVPTKGGCRAN